MLLNLSKIIAEPGKSVEFELDLDPEDIEEIIDEIGYDNEYYFEYS